MVQFTLPRNIVDLLLQRENPPRRQWVDRNDFVWLYRNQRLIVAPSWLTPSQMPESYRRVASLPSKNARSRQGLTKGEHSYWKCNDDLVTLHVAALTGAAVVSGDKFKDINAYLKMTSVVNMTRILREGQFTARWVNPIRNLWKLEPFYRSSRYGDAAMPFWKKCDVEQPGGTTGSP
eukprot:Protomagalhaensia_wolfi_Nauph_80__3082@NODE_3155_length_871_cov_73_110577_g1791_i2_p1_GENE_NODE_3155_length_871_cov_73_110577_g1791_i2NODE_3155_length_871_cov_73_110577_g1791_i2_p1_ORF_typecomplete_len177_score25_76RNase_Zc3h12a/PF11977_8/0_00015_NODE_3155_length_871_cov_73_110577_g1791_i2133663